MEANELRIGNWVMYGGYYEQVDFTDIADLSTGCGGAHLYKPIVLTPEILEKAGFVKDNEEYQHPGNTDFDLMFYQSINGLWCAYTFAKDADSERIPKGMVSVPICNPFKHLHSLQNLYFALTGIELNINL